MDGLKKVVKVEATTAVPLNIRGIFSKFGEIIDLYPCETGDRGCAHIFIKFKDEQSAKLAVTGKFDLPGINVYSLYDNPRYVSQYRGVDSVFETGAFCVPPNSRDIPVSTDPARKSAFRRSKKGYSRWATKSSGQFTDLVAPPINAYLCPPALPLQASFLDSLKSVQSRCSTPITRSITNPSGEIASKSQPASDVASNTASLTFSASLAPRASPESSPSTCAQPPSCTPGPLTFINPCFSLDTRLSLSFHGETITYDLKALDSDTRAIIELLKITDSERGNWMTVGAYYRRSGNTRAAMAVIRTMIEAMTEHGIPEGDLKPAFLFLSSCETDLARQAKTAQKITVEAAEHYKNARKWLQKVYGPGEPPAASQAASVMERNASSFPLQPSKATTQAIDRGDNVEPGNKLNQTSARAFAQQRILEREIQSLRDRQLEQSNLLSDTRAAKRKLEDDFDCERNLRYRLQRRLDDTRKELDMARKMEMYALDRVKREVETRRKAEDMAKGEKAQTLEFYDVSEEHTAQLLTEDAIAHVDQEVELER